MLLLEIKNGMIYIATTDEGLLDTAIEFLVRQKQTMTVKDGMQVTRFENLKEGDK